MSQELTCIGSLMVGTDTDCYEAFCELEELLELDPYDSVAIIDTPEGRLFDICIAEADVSGDYAHKAIKAIVDFTTKHGITGGVFKTGTEAGDIHCLGPTPVTRWNAHLKYLQAQLVDLQAEIEKVVRADLDEYLFDTERPSPAILPPRTEQ